ncbi:hypothetical protein [Brasilonema sp. UFV-L1]|uniref:hypothetical protein n=1 Tax=Brasilonema sp. UFV-L1 TaxID=2234130 RepID=UPI00145EEEB2|nr:hypothetical protein [Brasilonema sp. UFV-L1]NMG11428.1 hypothetical protein [Brasilonema sp. UFV-L1]
MSQNPLVEGVQSSKTTGLKSPLKAALASLEVQLDQELARYRRTQAGYRTPNQPRVSIPISTQIQQFTATSTTGSKTQLSAQDNFEESFHNIDLATLKTDNPSTWDQEESLLAETEINPPKSLEQTQDQVSASAATLDTLLPPQTSQPYTSISSKTQHLQSHIDSTPSNSAEAPTTPAANTIIVHTQIKEQGQTQSVNIAQSEDHTSKQPNDYLESSEALLRSFTEEEPKTHKPTNSDNSLLSPLGIGSMLLLLLGSLTLGYVVLNHKSIPQFSFNGLFQQNAPTTAENTADNTVEINNNVKTVAQPTLTPIPKNPNLATDEFPEVKNPNDVVGLKPQSKPTAFTNPGTAKNPTNPATKPNVQSTLGLDSTPSSEVTTSQEALKTQQKPDAEIKPSADGFYHVVIDNQGDRAFASARQIVPDAYLSADGKIIYLGALKSKKQAKTLLEELQAKGVNARIE